MGTLGEYRTTGADHFHSGVDIARDCAGATKAVVSGFTGVADWLDFPASPVDNGIEIWDSDEENWLADYNHVTNSRIAAGSVVAPETFVGNVHCGLEVPGNEIHDHVHAKFAPVGSNALAVLKGYVDSSDPTVSTIDVYLENSSNLFNLAIQAVFGKVDALVRANSGQSLGSPNTAPYKVDYRIEHANFIPPYNIIVDIPNTGNIEFNSSINNLGLGTVYHTGKSNNSIYYYWATNEGKNGAFANKYWNTRLAMGQAWDGSNAGTNLNAQYPDGIYSFVGRAREIACHFAELAQPVYVDNFRPFVERVRIQGPVVGQTDPQILYEAVRQFNSGTGNVNLTVVTNQSFNNAQTNTIFITFSERMNPADVAISIASVGAVAVVPTSQENRVFRGEFALPSQSTGTKQISISGRDHNLLGGQSNGVLNQATGSTSFPATAVQRAFSGNLVAQNGADANVTSVLGAGYAEGIDAAFSIVASSDNVPPVISPSLQVVKNQSFANVQGIVTDNQSGLNRVELWAYGPNGDTNHVEDIEYEPGFTFDNFYFDIFPADIPIGTTGGRLVAYDMAGNQGVPVTFGITPFPTPTVGNTPDPGTPTPVPTPTPTYVDPFQTPVIVSITVSQVTPQVSEMLEVKAKDNYLGISSYVFEQQLQDLSWVNMTSRSGTHSPGTEETVTIKLDYSYVSTQCNGNGRVTVYSGTASVSRLFSVQVPLTAVSPTVCGLDANYNQTGGCGQYPIWRWVYLEPEHFLGAREGIDFTWGNGEFFYIDHDCHGGEATTSFGNNDDIKYKFRNPVMPRFSFSNPTTTQINSNFGEFFDIQWSQKNAIIDAAVVDCWATVPPDKTRSLKFFANGSLVSQISSFSPVESHQETRPVNSYFNKTISLNDCGKNVISLEYRHPRARELRHMAQPPLTSPSIVANLFRELVGVHSMEYDNRGTWDLSNVDQEAINTSPATFQQHYKDNETYKFNAMFFPDDLVGTDNVPFYVVGAKNPPSGSVAGSSTFIYRVNGQTREEDLDFNGTGTLPSKAFAAEVGGVVTGPFYPNGIDVNPDIEFVKNPGASEQVLTTPFTLLAGNNYYVRLKNNFVGRVFGRIQGSADADQFNKYTLRYQLGGLTYNAGNPLADVDPRIPNFTSKVLGPSLGTLGYLNVSNKVGPAWLNFKMYGNYTDARPGYEVSINNDVIFQNEASFNIGHLVSAGVQTNIQDAYGKFDLNLKTVVDVFASIMPFRWVGEETAATRLNGQDELVLPQPSADTVSYVPGAIGEINLLKRITQIYSLMANPWFGPYSLNGPVTMTFRYTRRDLDFDLDGDGVVTDAERNHIEQNLGVYRYLAGSTTVLPRLEKVSETVNFSSGSGQYSTSDLGSSFVVMPAKSAPVITDFFATPPIFNPTATGAEGQARPTFYWKTSSPTAPRVWVKLEIRRASDAPTATPVSVINISSAGPGVSAEGFSSKVLKWKNSTKEYTGTSTNTEAFYSSSPWSPASWNGIDDGIYIATLTAKDGLGNKSIKRILLVKGSPMPDLLSVAGADTLANKNQAGSGTLAAQGSAVQLRGRAEASTAFKDYFVQIRRNDASAADPGTPWVSIPVPQAFVIGNYSNDLSTKPTLAHVQVRVNNLLAVLDSTLYPNGGYDLRVGVDLVKPVETSAGAFDDGDAQPVFSPVVYRVQISNEADYYGLAATLSPFQMTTTVQFSKISSGAPVSISIFDEGGGAAIATLSPVAGALDAYGNQQYSVTLDPTLYYGTPVPHTFKAVLNIDGDSSDPFILIKYLPAEDNHAQADFDALASQVSGKFEIHGMANTATLPAHAQEFSHFRFELVGPSPSDAVHLLVQSSNPVDAGGLLHLFDSREFDNGFYDLVLTVFDKAGNEAEASQSGFEINNQPELAVLPPSILETESSQLNYFLPKAYTSASLKVYEAPCSPCTVQVGTTVLVTGGVPEAQGSHVYQWTPPASSHSNYLVRLSYDDGVSPSSTDASLKVFRGTAVASPNIALQALDFSQVEGRPYFEWAVEGEGKYDSPQAFLYFVTTTAQENWNIWTGQTVGGSNNSNYHVSSSSCDGAAKGPNFSGAHDWTDLPPIGPFAGPQTVHFACKANGDCSGYSGCRVGGQSVGNTIDSTKSDNDLWWHSMTVNANDTISWGIIAKKGGAGGATAEARIYFNYSTPDADHHDPFFTNYSNEAGSFPRDISGAWVQVKPGDPLNDFSKKELFAFEHLAPTLLVNQYVNEFRPLHHKYKGFYSSPGYLSNFEGAPNTKWQSISPVITSPSPANGVVGAATILGNIDSTKVSQERLKGSIVELEQRWGLDDQGERQIAQAEVRVMKAGTSKSALKKIYIDSPQRVTVTTTTNLYASPDTYTVTLHADGNSSNLLDGAGHADISTVGVYVVECSYNYNHATDIASPATTVSQIPGVLAVAEFRRKASNRGYDNIVEFGKPLEVNIFKDTDNRDLFPKELQYPNAPATGLDYFLHTPHASRWKLKGPFYPGSDTVNPDLAFDRINSIPGRYTSVAPHAGSFTQDATGTYVGSYDPNTGTAPIWAQIDADDLMNKAQDEFAVRMSGNLP